MYIKTIFLFSVISKYLTMIITIDKCMLLVGIIVVNIY